MAVKTNKAPSPAMDNNADSARDLAKKAKKVVKDIGSPDLSKMVKTYNPELRCWVFKDK